MRRINRFVDVSNAYKINDFASCYNKNMRKNIYHVVVFLILIVIGLTPWVDGYIFKQNFFRLVEAVNEDNRIRVDVLDYKQGWLNSYAKVRVTLVDDELKPMALANHNKLNFYLPTSVILEEEIDHGPVIYNSQKNRIELGYAGVESYLHLTEAIDKSLLAGNDENGLIQLSLLYKFNGDWEGDLQVPVLSLTVPSIGKVMWYGLEGRYLIKIHNDQLKHMTVNMNIGSLMMDGEHKNPLVTQISIEPMQYMYDAVHDKMGLWSGNANLSTAGASIIMSDGSVFAAQGVVVNSAFSATATTFYNTNFTVKMNNLITPSQIVPVFSKVQISLSANDFSAENVNRYIKFIRSNTLNDVKNINLNLVEALLVRTIIPSSYFKIDATSETTLGLFATHSKTTWKNNAALPNTFYDVIANSYTIIDVQASAPITTKIVEIYGKIMKYIAAKKPPTNKPSSPLPDETTQQIIDQMVWAGFISKEKYGYSATLTVDDGVWKISGLVISPE